MNTLLLEIGTEEIPAGYIAPALDALASNLLKQLDNARIDHGNTRVYGTPRRLAIEVAAVADKQNSLETQILGPPEKAGFDENGKPKIAAQKFAEKAGVPLSAIRITETEKGRYLCADIIETGRNTKDMLQNILPELITAIPFPKTMKWADSNIQFARPVHSLLAILGSDVIPFKLETIEAGKLTFGHRFMSPDKVEVPVPEDYVNILRTLNVIVDPAERRKLVEKEIAMVAESLKGKILPDAELVDIVNNLVEYPVAVAGKFDTVFLEVPDEVLINAMREHQKYFAVIDNAGKLMPCFIAVNNTRAKDMAVVAKGHERVLRARLSDARFFYKSDLEILPDDRLSKLKGVLFQAKLGSMYEKSLRVQQIAEYIAEEIDPGSELKNHASRAAILCKTDLVSQVVNEFPKLQGVMGRVYAKCAGEPDSVASAIEEHYRPTYSGGILPSTITGAVVAVADKIDSICGCFSAGLEPTGASDPYALRRQGIGILQIMHEKGLTFSLKALIKKSAELFSEKSKQSSEITTEKVYAFLQSRMDHLLSEEKFSKDVIAAITSISIDHIPNVRRRAGALEKLKSAPDFEPLAIAFKRVVNIIRKAGIEAGSPLGDINKSLFEHESESALYNAWSDVKKKVEDDLIDGLFDQALIDIASLRDSVDAFFDGVMVMTEDEKRRSNRLSLLRHIAALFENFADFSKIST